MSKNARTALILLGGCASLFLFCIIVITVVSVVTRNSRSTDHSPQAASVPADGDDSPQHSLATAASKDPASVSAEGGDSDLVVVIPHDDSERDVMGVGDPITIAGLTSTVLGIEWKLRAPMQMPLTLRKDGTGALYAFVRVRVHNSWAGWVCVPTYRVFSMDGCSESEPLTADSPDENMLPWTVNAGETVEGYVVYRSRTDESLRLEITGGYASTARVLVQLPTAPHQYR